MSPIASCKTELGPGSQKGRKPIKTSDEIRTMCNARTTWSIAKSLSGCGRPKDDVRLKRNESALRKRRLRKENAALRRTIHQMENLFQVEVKYNANAG